MVGRGRALQDDCPEDVQILSGRDVEPEELEGSVRGWDFQPLLWREEDVAPFKAVGEMWPLIASACGVPKKFLVSTQRSEEGVFYRMWQDAQAREEG